MKHFLWIILVLLVGNGRAQSTEQQLQQLKNHAMQYYVSLPKGWSANKTWPVIVVLEAAEKEYKKNLERFIAARKDKPFILVAPIHLNNGNAGRREPALFPYSPETWDIIEKMGDCAFDTEGISQVIREVSEKYKGEEKVYLTGFEAGAHTVWSLVFNHPEWLKAAAVVEGNFRNRCVEPSTISKDASIKTLPVVSLVGDKDEGFGPNGKVYDQWKNALALATTAGYGNVTEKVIPGVGHQPMPGEVMIYFSSLINK